MAASIKGLFVVVEIVMVFSGCLSQGVLLCCTSKRSELQTTHWNGARVELCLAWKYIRIVSTVSAKLAMCLVWSSMATAVLLNVIDKCVCTKDSRVTAIAAVVVDQQVYS